MTRPPSPHLGRLLEFPQPLLKAVVGQMQLRKEAPRVLARPPAQLCPLEGKVRLPPNPSRKLFKVLGE